MNGNNQSLTRQFIISVFYDTDKVHVSEPETDSHYISDLTDLDVLLHAVCNINSPHPDTCSLEA